MHDSQSSYAFWSWLVAMGLGIVLLLMYLNGNGPRNICCDTDKMPAKRSLSSIDKNPIVTEAFSFSATDNEFTGHGDASNIIWISDLDALKALLRDDLKAEGDELTVTLTGEVDSEETKQQKLKNAQAFFGPDVSINNQITVAMPMQ